MNDSIAKHIADSVTLVNKYMEHPAVPLRDRTWFAILSLGVPLIIGASIPLLYDLYKRSVTKREEQKRKKKDDMNELTQISSSLQKGAKILLDFRLEYTYSLFESRIKFLKKDMSEWTRLEQKADEYKKLVTLNEAEMLSLDSKAEIIMGYRFVFSERLRQGTSFNFILDTMLPDGLIQQNLNDEKWIEDSKHEIWKEVETCQDDIYYCIWYIVEFQKLYVAEEMLFDGTKVPGDKVEENTNYIAFEM